EGKWFAGGGENVTGQGLLEVLGALWRPIDEQEGRSGRHDIDHADQGLLGYACAPRAREGQNDGGKESEDTRVTIGGDALGRMTEHKCDGGPERRNLGKRQIDKDHFA